MSRHKDRYTWLVVGLVLVAVAAAAYFVVWPYLRGQTTLHIGDGVFKAQVQTALNVKKTTGELPENKAIITIYEQEGVWQADMHERTAHYDIVWLDNDKKVVHIVKNASSESDYGAVFSPEKAARYIIELRAGTVERKAINLNGKAVFNEAKAAGKETK